MWVAVGDSLRITHDTFTDPIGVEPFSRFHSKYMSLKASRRHSSKNDPVDFSEIHLKLCNDIARFHVLRLLADRPENPTRFRDCVPGTSPVLDHALALSWANLEWIRNRGLPWDRPQHGPAVSRCVDADVHGPAASTLV